MLYDEINSFKPRSPGDDDALNDNNGSNDLEFDFQFGEYFLRLSDKKNVKLQVTQFFTIIFLQIAVLHNMRWAIWECDQSWLL